MTDLVDVPVRPPHSAFSVAVDGLIRVCAILPYMLVGFILRAAIARPFFLSGQAMVDGPKIPFGDTGFVLTIPVQLREEILRLFENRLDGTGLSAKTMAYLVCGAEILLPILLILGLATRFTALALIVLVIALDQYLEPGMFWSVHIYWYAILLVLVSLGAGAISLDRVIRYFYDR